jgi:hypothetical protein
MLLGFAVLPRLDRKIQPVEQYALKGKLVRLKFKETFPRIVESKKLQVAPKVEPPKSEK